MTTPLFQSHKRTDPWHDLAENSKLIRAPIPGAQSPLAKQCRADAWHQAISKANKKPAGAG